MAFNLYLYFRLYLKLSSVMYAKFILNLNCTYVIVFAVPQQFLRVDQLDAVLLVLLLDDWFILSVGCFLVTCVYYAFFCCTYCCPV